MRKLGKYVKIKRSNETALEILAREEEELARKKKELERQAILCKSTDVKANGIDPDIPECQTINPEYAAAMIRR